MFLSIIHPEPVPPLDLSIRMVAVVCLLFLVCAVARWACDHFLERMLLRTPAEAESDRLACAIRERAKRGM